MVDKRFFNPHGDIKFPNFSHVKKGSVFVNFRLFFLNIMTFFQKNRHDDQPNRPHISY